MKLENWGYISPVAFTSQDAVKQFKNTKPDLVIMDIKLKGKLNGIDTAKLIDSNLQVPIIYYSSNTDEELSERLKHTQNREYISKTSGDDTLKKSIEKFVKKKSNVIDSTTKLTAPDKNLSKDFKPHIQDINKTLEEVTINNDLTKIRKEEDYFFKDKCKINTVGKKQDLVTYDKNKDVSVLVSLPNNDEDLVNENIDHEYYGSQKNIEFELNNLETNFSKIFKRSKSQHEEIVKLNNLLVEYKQIVLDKEVKIDKLKHNQRKLEEKMNNYKNQYQTVLNEIQRVNDQINRFIGNLSD